MKKITAIVITMLSIGVSICMFCVSANAREIIGCVQNPHFGYALAWTLPFLSFGTGILGLLFAVQVAVLNFTGINLYKTLTDTLEFVLTYKDTD